MGKKYSTVLPHDFKTWKRLYRLVEGSLRLCSHQSWLLFIFRTVVAEG